MPSLTFSSKYIGFREYQPDPEDLCSLCGGNFGKAAMIEGKDKIHICMECVDLLGVMKKERDDKKRCDAISQISNAIIGDVPDTGMATAAMYAERIYDAIKSGKIVID
ncbi:hypothetical protein Q2V57_15320 [Enterobacter bugandensis]|uniref:hypothetical protein n=1 Tax=Enterobacter bugandensis TaxID=881260 RepID=UPI002665FCAC|nr:hypothetical protein [Enterobacter bugandensis]MDO2432930.1 hypothetical protein [Enterobacter bugandensis]MDO2445973.1 hypothetical protein [Enterobacter bugandensis]